PNRGERRAPIASSGNEYSANAGWVDAAAVAEYLSVERAWVYEHADELDARQLGRGPRARLRFRLDKVDAWLDSCCGDRQSPSPEPAPAAVIRRRRPRRAGSAVELLPVRGRPAV